MDRPLTIKATIIRHTTRQDAIKALRTAVQQSDDIGGARDALTAAAALEAASDIRPNVAWSLCVALIYVDDNQETTLA